MDRPLRSPTLGRSVAYGHGRSRNLERRYLGVEWVYVGTDGVDGVDALLTADSPPYESPWTYIGSPWLAMRFRMLDEDKFELEGGATGGSVGTVIFVVPASYRPSGDLEIPASRPDGTFSSLLVDASTGEVTQVS